MFLRLNLFPLRRRSVLRCALVCTLKTKASVCLRGHAEALGWKTPNWPQSRTRTQTTPSWVSSTYQMWDSSGIGSLDFVKKFFATAPWNNKVQKTVKYFYSKMLLFFLFFLIFRWMHLRCRWAVHTQDESPQVRLQALELISVILQLFLCDPPGVILSIIWNSLLLEPFYWGSLSTYRKSKWHNTDLIKHICKSLKRKTSVPEP